MPGQMPIHRLPVNMEKIKDKILLIEGNENDRIAFMRLVESESLGHECMAAGSIEEARDILLNHKIDVVISDYRLSDGSVFDVFDVLTDTPVIVVTGSGDEGVAVKAMKAGAYDYLKKDPELYYLKILPVTIENAIKRKKAEERLRLLESAVANASDAIIILEAEPAELQGRRILYVNEAYTEMTGYTYEEATSKTLRMLRGPKTNLEALAKIKIALEEFKPVRVELTNYRKDGSEFWAECNIVPFTDEKGAFIHWVSVQRDITERKQAEEEKERLLKEIEAMNFDLTELNHELETIGAERTMSLMALTVADRIRNPASIIGGRCRRILHKEDLSDSMKDSLHCIIEGAEKLDQIVKDFEAILYNRQSKFKNDDMNKVVERVVSIIAKEAELKEIDVSVVMSTEPLRMNMQQELLRVAVFHILKNAVEATSQGGRINVETACDGDNVSLTVSDTGHGIQDVHAVQVFKPFFSTKDCGFGMGLPLVKQIVSEHLGELVVRSNAGRGTTFRMVFPVRWKEDRLYN